MHYHYLGRAGHRTKGIHFPVNGTHTLRCRAETESRAETSSSTWRAQPSRQHRERREINKISGKAMAAHSGLTHTCPAESRHDIDSLLLLVMH